MQIDSLEKRRIVFYAPELHAESGRALLPAGLGLPRCQEHRWARTALSQMLGSVPRRLRGLG